MRGVLGAVVAAGLALAAGAGQAKTYYECSFERLGGNMGWVPEAAVIAYDASAQTATANDPLTAMTNKQPVPAKVIADNDKRSTFSWEVKGLTSGTGQRVRLLLRLTVLKGDLAASLTAKPVGYDSHFSAQGRCRLGKL